MPKIRVRLNKSPRNAEVIPRGKSDDALSPVKYSREILFDERLPKTAAPPPKSILKPKEKKPVFIEEFSISSSGEPVEISLLKIPEETMPLEEVKKEVQSAYDRGFEDGQQVTRSLLETEIQKQQEWIKNFDTLAGELRLQYSAELNKLEDSVIPLSLMIAGHILEHEVDADSNIVIEQTRKAIAMLKDDTIFKIHINPENIEILEKIKSSLLSDSLLASQIQVIQNNGVDKLGCILETSAGIIDARIKKQLEKIQRSLTNISLMDEPEEVTE